jgi:hypothetical protein
VCNPSNRLKEKYKPGELVIVQDSFEFEEFPHSLWEFHRENPVFSELKKFSEYWEAPVETSLLMENSIIATEDNFDAIKSEPLLVAKNYAHFVQ